MTELTTMAAIVDDEQLQRARTLLDREAVLLDEQRWQDWLALYTADCEYWVPTWKADRTLASDPRRELSYIYYASRSGLEDRVLRFTSPSSPASYPAARTTHMVSQVMRREDNQNDAVLRVRSSWTVHIAFPATNRVSCNFGYSLHDLVLIDQDLKIARKKTVIQNDYMETMLDVYCI